LTLLLFFIEFKIYKVDRILSNECGGQKRRKKIGDEEDVSGQSCM
jgi:hypothetical protein